MFSRKGFDSNLEFGRASSICDVVNGENNESLKKNLRHFSNDYDMIISWAKVNNYTYKPNIILQIDRDNYENRVLRYLSILY